METPTIIGLIIIGTILAGAGYLYWLTKQTKRKNTPQAFTPEEVKKMDTGDRQSFESNTFLGS